MKEELTKVIMDAKQTIWKLDTLGIGWTVQSEAKTSQPGKLGSVTLILRLQVENSRQCPLKSPKAGKFTGMTSKNRRRVYSSDREAQVPGREQMGA